MAETDELSVGANNMAISPSPIPDKSTNPAKSNLTSKVSEEGEISSSDDDVSRVQETVAIQATPVGSKRTSSNVKLGRSFPASNLESSVDFQSRSFLQSIHHNKFEKNSLPPKSTTSGRYLHSLADNNLVIKFSDGESGSDSEENIEEKSLRSRGNADCFSGVRRPPVLSAAKPEVVQQAARTRIKPLSKNLLSSRPFISAIAQINGSKSIGSAPYLIAQGSHTRDFSTSNKNIAIHQRGCKQGVGLDDSKLQGLRAQIAILETELKLKSSQQSKETISGPSRAYKDTSMLPNDGMVRIGRAASAEAEEPEKKRLKLGRPYSAQLVSDNLREVPVEKSVLVSKALSEENDLHKSMKLDNGQFENITIAASTQSDTDRCRKQDNNQMDVPLGNVTESTDCADTKAGYKQQYSSTVQENPDAAQFATSVNVTSIGFTDKLKTVQSNLPSQIHGHNHSSSLKNSAACRHNSTSIRSNESCEVVYGDKLLGVAGGMLESAEGFPKNSVLWNRMDNVNDSRPANISLQSLLEIEELHDKELEEAQQYRSRCEVEERNALKEYRKSQRALVEANARCSYLYREREVFSARLQSYIMNNSSLPWSSRQDEHPGIRFNSSHDISDGNPDTVPKSMNRLFEYDVFSQRGCKRASLGTSYGQYDGRNLGSDPSSEPDGSTSELLLRKGNKSANRAGSPSNDSNRSADGDEDTFSCDRESIKPNQEHEEREEGVNDVTKIRYPIHITQDPLLLEATLRSKLVAQLRMKNLSKGNSQNDDSVEPDVERGAGNNPGNEKLQRSTEELLYSEAEMSRQHHIQGTMAEKIASEVSVHTDNQSPSHATAGAESEELRDSTQLTGSVRLSTSSIIRSTFGHMKVISPNSFIGLPFGVIENDTFKEQNQECGSISSEVIRPSNWLEGSKQVASSNMFARGVSSLTSNLEIDPFWPLCMYELRGKCNNEECSGQHVKDYGNKNVDHPTDPHSADCMAGSSDQGKYNDAMSHGQCWQKNFGAHLSVSRFLQRDSSMATQFHHDKDGRVKIQGRWSRPSLFLQNGGGNQMKQPADYIHCLEKALLVLNQEVDRTEGMKKVLSIMSRALEASPTSVPLWAVYLLIYYTDNKPAGNTADLFFHAVKHNEGSYELWILYINSRMLLDDRLHAYDTALRALFRGASSPDRDAIYTSACILDLFLQKMECLCMSGNFGESMQSICGFFSSTTNLNEPHTLLPSDLLAFLTFSDKCILWVCCLHLVIYRKLPDDVLRLFECEKEPFLVELPSTGIGFDKQLAVKLMEKAMDCIQMDISSESLQSEKALKSMSFFACTHVGCIEALQGRECSQKLLVKYMKLYPSCLELFVMSARLEEHSFKDLTYAGFEEALSKWPKEFPGIQCIWNQYAQYALENGSVDVGKEVMLRWYDSASKIQNHPPSEDQIALHSNKLDTMFWMLNLGLYRLFQNDQIEAQLAVDSALDASPPESYKHCVREHAMLLRSCLSQSGEKASLSVLINALKRYLVDARNSPSSEPLSRRFIQNIKKPRVQKLVNDILDPVSFNATLVNLVLEVWHGPSLLPNFDKLHDLVNFVENIIEIAPSDYRLAFSVCKLLIKDCNSSPSVLYWAISVLVDTIFNSVPVPPEYIFVEASGIIGNIMGFQSISKMFHTRALDVYPFSIKLWKSHLNFSISTGDKMVVVEAARERGIKIQ